MLEETVVALDVSLKIVQRDELLSRVGLRREIAGGTERGDRAHLPSDVQN